MVILALRWSTEPIISTSFSQKVNLEVKLDLIYEKIFWQIPNKENMSTRMTLETGGLKNTVIAKQALVARAC